MRPDGVAQLKKALAPVLHRLAKVLDRVDARVLDRLGADDLRDADRLQTVRLVLHAETQRRNAAVGGKDRDDFDLQIHAASLLTAFMPLL